MTRDKAIEEVKNYENYPNGLSKECRDYIVKALEQEPVLDKVRAEIIEKNRNVKAVRSDSCCFFTAEELLQIIDKYKEENETDIQKTCENCRYCKNKFKKFPCVDCLEKDRWEQGEVE